MGKILRIVRYFGDNPPFVLPEDEFEHDRRNRIIIAYGVPVFTYVENESEVSNKGIVFSNTEVFDDGERLSNYIFLDKRYPAEKKKGFIYDAFVNKDTIDKKFVLSLRKPMNNSDDNSILLYIQNAHSYFEHKRIEKIFSSEGVVRGTKDFFLRLKKGSFVHVDFGNYKDKYEF